MKRAKLRLEDYPFTIRPLATEDGGGYLIEFPDVPGCISDGKSPEEAIANGRDALRSALLTMREFADPISLHESHRGDSAGSTRVARLAGIRHAANETSGNNRRAG
jgi:predicted RNase H-like HicB family nuclease